MKNIGQAITEFTSHYRESDLRSIEAFQMKFRGATLSEIGKVYGLSKERIRQMVDQGRRKLIGIYIMDQKFRTL